MTKLETRLACTAGHVWSGTENDPCPDCDLPPTRDVVMCPASGSREPHALWVARSLKGPLVTCPHCAAKIDFAALRRLIRAGRPGV